MRDVVLWLGFGLYGGWVVHAIVAYVVAFDGPFCLCQTADAILVV